MAHDPGELITVDFGRRKVVPKKCTGRAAHPSTGYEDLKKLIGWIEADEPTPRDRLHVVE